MNGTAPDFAARLMKWAMRFAGEERADWAHAMAAELPHVEGRKGRLSWSVSCSLLLFRQWLRRKFTKSTETKFEGRTMKRPVIAAVCTCVVLVVGLCCLPEFREGLSVAKAFLGSALTSRVGYSEAELTRLEQRAEREHNAELMAYSALHSNEGWRGGKDFLVEARRRARRAVQMDAQYTWIYQPLCEDSRTYVIVECAEMIRELETWDPVNSVPYLMEASRLNWENDPQNRLGYNPPDDSRWYAAMAHAFAAARYEPYGTKDARLEQSVYQQLHQGRLVDVMEGLVLTGRTTPSYGEINKYVKVALARNPQDVIDFGRRVIAGGETDYDELVGLKLLEQGQKRSNDLKPGSVSETEIADDDKLLSVTVEHLGAYYDSFVPLAFAFQGLVLLLVVSTATLVSLLSTAAWYWVRSKVPSNFFQTATAILSAIVGFLSVALWQVYNVFSGLAHEALKNPSPGRFVGPQMVWSLSVPLWWNWSWQSLWTWEIVLGLCVIALVVVVGRATRRGGDRATPA